MSYVCQLCVCDYLLVKFYLNLWLFNCTLYWSIVKRKKEKEEKIGRMVINTVCVPCRHMASKL